MFNITVFITTLPAGHSIVIGWNKGCRGGKIENSDHKKNLEEEKVLVIDVAKGQGTCYLSKESINFMKICPHRVAQNLKTGGVRQHRRLGHTYENNSITTDCSSISD